MTLAPTRGQVTVTAAREVDASATHRLWRLYRDCFAELRALAASRHLLSRQDFEHHVTDPRVEKIVAYLDEQPVGLLTLTTHLASVSWISSDFYAARYPNQAARGAVFYCGLAMVHPFARQTEAFPRMVSLRAPDIVAARGVLAADLCRVNIEETELSRLITVLMRRAWGGARQVELDRQVFYAWEPPAEPRRAPVQADRRIDLG